MVTVVVFEFSVMRCQPLRRALDEWSSSDKRNEVIYRELPFKERCGNSRVHNRLSVN
nr:acetyltransferase [Vibrio cholerae]